MRLRELTLGLLLLGAPLALADEADPTLTKHLEALELKSPHGDLAEEVRAFYEARGDTLAWKKPERQAERLLGALCALEREGISPSRVDTDGLTEALRAAKRKPSAETRSRLDVTLTATFFRAAALVDRGQVSPNKHRWNIDDVPTPLGPALTEALKKDDFARALEALAPDHEGYRTLRAELERLRKEHARGGWPEVPEGTLLEKGMSDERVISVRSRLRATGELKAPVREGEEERRFDEELEKAVSEFQRRHGLEIDGRIGQETLAELRRDVTERIAQVAANLERWRWLPAKLPEAHVRVNLPAQEVQAWKEGKRVFTSPVVIGAEGWKTPVFADEIEAIEVNPRWWVPSRIAAEEVIPMLADRSEWAASQGFRAVDRESGEWKRPTEVEWNQDSYARWAIVQQAGEDNPLGKAKFIMRNRYAVFLHGTDSPEAFQLTERARSHGCVRVQKVDALAAFLAGSDEKTKAFTEAKAGSENTRLELERPVPVLLVYFTAYVDEARALRFAPDVYQHDGRLERALTEPEEPAPACS